MKSPADVRDLLRRRWNHANARVQYLLDADAWPMEIKLGLPTSSDFTQKTAMVQQHARAWRRETIGEIVWQDKRYRGASEVVSLPSILRLHNAEQWVRFCADKTIADKHDTLSTLINRVAILFHETLIRRRSLWQSTDVDSVVAACEIAMRITPGMAAGRPLRLLSEFSVDTKFFDRHRGLLVTLLDLRFDGECSAQGLESFLKARPTGEHWLLVCDLDGELLPFPEIRVTSSALQHGSLPGTRLLIIENENCRHLLPPLPTTLAVLGTGFDIDWTAAPWLQHRDVDYWGDIDTWGFTILAGVRRNLPNLRALLMDQATFDSHAAQHVTEPTPAPIDPPTGLTATEQALYRTLHRAGKGRLEQEFLRPDLIAAAMHRCDAT
ncbi:MAG: Wadjet anti-phage system protein JetD domain-containing protein [Planctomycetota bacterium]